METSALSWETNLNASDLYGCFSPLKDAHTVRNAGLLLLGVEKGSIPTSLQMTSAGPSLKVPIGCW